MYRSADGESQRRSAAGGSLLVERRGCYCRAGEVRMHRLLAALVIVSMASVPAAAAQSRKSKSKPKQQQLEPPPPTPPTSAAPAPAAPAASGQPAAPLPSTQPALPSAKPKGEGTTLGLYRLVRKGETDPLLKTVDDAFPGRGRLQAVPLGSRSSRAGR